MRDRNPSPFGAATLAACAVLTLPFAAAPGLAQASGAAQDDIEEVSQPVVQAIPGLASKRLNEALARIAKDPQDVPALLDAGKAALGVGDVDAAVGFYQRAERLAPTDSGVKAGLAAATVRRRDPVGAIALFDAAEQLGQFDPALLSDRGLAYDLVGDNGQAQRYYRQVQTFAPNDENARRLALSLAIAGDRRGMETTLAPLLQKGDKAAWRTRTFGYAVAGQPGEAEAIARTIMPAAMADQIAPYLKFMPRLTRAQQAAAATFGQFPRSADIGIDDPRIAAYAAANPARVASATNTGAGLAPAGQPLGQSGAPARAAARPAARPARAAETPRAVSVAVVDLRQPPAPPPASIQTAPGGAASTAAPLAAPPVAAAPAQQVAPPAPRPAAPAPARPSLADVFADLSAPSREVVPVEGAVDLRALPAAKPSGTAAPTAAAKPPAKGKDAAAAPCTPAPAKGRKPAVVCPPPKDCDPKAGAGKQVKGKKPDPRCEVEAKPAKQGQPSRIWVQVATGRSKSALAFDWRKLAREEEAVLRGRKPFTAQWGQTNRLLTGPFESERAADAYIAQLKKAGIAGAFSWTSPAGQAVDPLPLGK